MGVNVGLCFRSYSLLAQHSPVWPASWPDRPTVQGMGELILILSLVVTVIGGIGSVRGAFITSLLVGIVDTFGRVLLPPALGSMIIFVFMAIFLAHRPQGLFATGR